MSRARSVRVERTRNMGQHGVRRCVAPIVTSHCASPGTRDALLCKQGVVGSNPISSTRLTSMFVRSDRSGGATKPALRVECASEVSRP